MLIAIGALRDQSPDEGFVHRAVPFRRPDHLLHNHAVPVDHPALGHARRLVGPLDGAGLIVQDVEREPQLARERGDDRVAALIDAHRQDLEVLPSAEPLMQALHGGHLDARSEEHTSELQSLAYLVCRLLLEKKKKKTRTTT